MKKIFATLLTAIALGGFMTSCDNDENGPKEVLYTYSFSFTDDNYNSDGYWVNVYNVDEKNFFVPPTATFSHRAAADEWDGVVYRSYKGFCPTRVSDTSDHTGQDWTLYQWASIAPTNGAGYLIACWDVAEADGTDINDRSCAIGFGNPVRPVSMLLTNTTYGYYVMLNGSAFSKPFGKDDWCKLTIHGVAVDKSETTIDFYLAKDGELTKEWKNVDLTGLGEVKAIYFTMSSSDSGTWGMNNPAYFALGSMTVVYSSEAL